MSRILLTGASGFIGRHALPLLVARGHEVHAVARKIPLEQQPDGVLWHRADLLNSAESAALIEAIGPEALLHLAWDVEPGRFWTSVESVRWVEASLALMRAVTATGAGRAVMAGSCAEYDWRRASAAMDERTPIAPATLYGACKHATHLVSAKLAEQAGCSFAWGRIFYLYGPHEQRSRLVPAVATSLLRGEAVETTDGLQRRDFMHVADVAGAFVALLESDVEGAVNIASGEAPEVRELIGQIAAATGAGELVRWGSVARGDGDPEILGADTRRLRDDVGYSPAIALAGGLQATVEWWRERLALPPLAGAAR